MEERSGRRGTPSPEVNKDMQGSSAQGIFEMFQQIPQSNAISNHGFQMSSLVDPMRLMGTMSTDASVLQHLSLLSTVTHPPSQSVTSQLATPSTTAGTPQLTLLLTSAPSHPSLPLNRLSFLTVPTSHAPLPRQTPYPRRFQLEGKACHRLRARFLTKSRTRFRLGIQLYRRIMGG
ncbi:hypothetical protein BC829DRAFT_12166 [Chytridium lagenaria]|nr:hypothetical protein BC829DRAFT_12166 [Chytridium lagenaria]